MKKTPKERVLSKAQELFYKQGYRNTGIKQILDESKVSRSSFYDHFSSKDDLALAYLHEIGRLSQCGCEEFFQSKLSPYEKIIGLFDFTSDQFVKKNFIGCPMQNLTSEIELEFYKEHQKAVIDKKDHISSDIRNVVEQLKEQSRKHSEIDVDLITNTVFILLEGAMTSSRIYRDTWPFTKAQDSLKKIIG